MLFKFIGLAFELLLMFLRPVVHGFPRMGRGNSLAFDLQPCSKSARLGIAPPLWVGSVSCSWTRFFTTVPKLG